jgi:hypothetical protein
MEMVKKNRIERPEIIRKELSDYLAGAHKCFYCGILKKRSGIKEDVKQFLDISSETTAIGYRLILRFNPNDDNKIIELINELNIYISGNEITVSPEDFYKKIQELVTESHYTLQTEWEKASKEVGYKNSTPAVRGGCFVAGINSV